MSIEIKGINNLIRKLNNISNIETNKIVEEVAAEVEISVRNKAKSFSNSGYQYVGTYETRNYGLSSYIDIGLKNDEAPFSLWKNLWFHQWGYFDKGWNFGEKGPYIQMHRLWFDEGIKEVEKETKKNLKEKLNAEIQKEWKR